MSQPVGLAYIPPKTHLSPTTKTAPSNLANSRTGSSNHKKEFAGFSMLQKNPARCIALQSCAKPLERLLASMTNCALGRPGACLT